MADINPTPRISCDNCGFTEDKTRTGSGDYSKSFGKPRTWGSCKIEGGRDADSYGGKARLDFTDLCPMCATAALEGAHLRLRRFGGRADHG